MQDAWQARWPLGARSRKGAREIYVDDLRSADWQKLATYSVLSGPIKVEIVAITLAVEGFQATVDEIALRAGQSQQAVMRGPVDARRGDVLELYLAPRITAAIARDLRAEVDDVRRLTVSFDYWGVESRTNPERLTVDLLPRLSTLGRVTFGIEPAQAEVQLPAAGGGSRPDRIDLATFTSSLPPTARLLKDAVVHSSVAVDVAAADGTVRALVGDCLTLMPDADDLGVADIAAERRQDGSGGWVFGIRSLIDVARPSRQRLSLDTGLLNRRLHDLAPLGAQGRLPVEIRLAHAIVATSDEGPQEQVGQHALPMVIDYDLNPRFFLDLPAPGAALRLFEEPGRGSRASRYRIPIPAPPQDDEGRLAGSQKDVPLPITLRRVGGNAVERLMAWYHIAGLHTDYQPLAEVTFEPRGDEPTFTPHVMRLPIAPVIERFRSERRPLWQLSIYLMQLREPQDQSLKDEIAIDLVVEQSRDGALLCIDWGTSSIAAGFSDDRDPGNVLALPLGRVFREASPQGSARGAQAGAVRLDEEMDDLIPSRVALASRLNFRAGARPFSFTDLRARGLEDAAVVRRIRALERHYDIALPFTGRLKPEDEAFVMPALKLLLAEDRNLHPLRERVIARLGGTELVRVGEVSVPGLVLDCLDELRGFYLTESVRLLAGEDPGRSTRLKQAVMSDGLRLVLTHPCGLGRRLLDRYRQAGHHLLARMDRGLLPELPIAGGAAAEESGSGRGVILVPESLAAAYHALSVEMASGSRIGEGAARLVALDFGAGTFDVSVLDVKLRGRAPEPWDVRCHYGVRIGGLDIDKALTRLVDALLENLVIGHSLLAYVHPVSDEVPRAGVSDSEAIGIARFKFGQALEHGKRELTAALFATADAGGGWAWTGDRRLVIKVGRVGDPSWPVQAKITGRSPPKPGGETIASLPGNQATLSLVREVDRVRNTYEDFVVLEIANVFSREAMAALAEYERIHDALHDLVSLGELVTQRLPEASLGWLKARGKAAPAGTATYLAVTGRAALWPPVFAGFQRLAAALGAAILGSRGGAQPAPMLPDAMKKAVMYGAYQLARQPAFLERPIPSAPLAIRFEAAAGPRSAGSLGRIEYLDDLVGDGSKGELTRIEGGSLFQLSRVVPGIERLADVIDDQSPKLWSDLLPSFLNPVALTSDMRRTPERVQVEVERGGDGSIEVVTFTADHPHGRPHRRRIDDDGSTFIADRRGATSPWQVTPQRRRR
jgi:hypothetical protein